MFYAVWIPIVIIFYVMYSLASKQNQLVGGRWFWITLLMGTFPGWAIISRYTKNILWDGILYDIFMYLTFIITMMFIGETKSFALHQWSGLVMIVIGFILMRI